MYKLIGENYSLCINCKKTIGGRLSEKSIKKYGIVLCCNCETWLKEIQEKSTYFTIRLYFELRRKNIPAEIEKFDGFKHIDIAIPKAKVNIEVDGIHHNNNPKQALSDLKRTYYSLAKNYYTIRIPNCLTNNIDNLTEATKYIEKIINLRLNNSRSIK